MTPSVLAYFQGSGNNDFLMSEVRSKFLQDMTKKFPALGRELIDPLVSENLLSPTVLKLPVEMLHQAQAFVSAAFSLRQKPAYLQNFEGELAARNLKDPGNNSIAMSYDFHVDPSGNLKLIEINTNASFLALSELLYEAHGLVRPVADFSWNELRDNLLQELNLSGHQTPPQKTLIVDEVPSEQRLYIEFLLYREIFKSWGWNAEILDTRTPSLDANLIYNRDTDFYFEKLEHQELKKNWLDQKICLSPQPVEYLYLADKERQLQWGRPGFLESTGLAQSEIQTLRRHLPFALDLTSHNSDELWEKRKSLFLKPKRSFGAKQSFRGASISKKAYVSLIDQDILVQEYIPAPEIQIGSQTMKYDLRFYAYQGRVQTAVARLYQGQVTNLRTPGGGFTAIQFVPK